MTNPEEEVSECEYRREQFLGQTLEAIRDDPEDPEWTELVFTSGHRIWVQNLVWVHPPLPN